MSRASVIVACAALATAAAGAAQFQPPPPSPGQTAAGGPPPTATIRGRVIAGDSGQPLRKAEVRLYPTDGNGLRENRVAATDADGRYEFTAVAAGRYSLT